MSLLQRCRKCGCTEAQACVSIEGPCYWIEEDLCSACGENAGPAIHPADMAALANVQDVHLQVSGPQAMMLLSVIQLALRCPGLDPRQAICIFSQEIGRAIQEKISVTPALGEVAELGWGVNQNAKTKALKPGRIILPPGR